MAGDESAVIILPPAVHGDAVRPRGEIHAAIAGPVRRHLVRNGDGDVGTGTDDQPVEPVEQRPVPGRDRVHVIADVPVRLFSGHRGLLLRWQQATGMSSLGPCYTHGGISGLRTSQQ